MREMAREQAPRGKPIAVPDWWIDEIDRAAEDWDNVTLAEVLSEKYGRKLENSQIMRGVRKRSKRRVVTMELADILSDFFGVPAPVYVAETLAEALRIARTLARKPPPSVTLASIDERIAEVRGKYTAKQERHNERSVERPDGGHSKGRHAARVARGRRKAPPR